MLLIGFRVTAQLRFFSRRDDGHTVQLSPRV